MKNEINNFGVVGFPLDMILTTIFVVLKLTGNIAWSWWWVFSPLWIPCLLLIAIGLIFVACGQLLK